MAEDDLAADAVAGLDPGGLLAAFNRAGVLLPADVHVALALSRLGGEKEPLVQLAAALAVRAPRTGHVLADLSTARATVVAGEGERGLEGADLSDLPWPELEFWLEAIERSPLFAVEGSAQAPGADGQTLPDASRPLHLWGTAVYLDRYWRDEGLVAGQLLARATAAPLQIDEIALETGVGRLFPEGPSSMQAVAAKVSVRRLISVIVGGPGTGKTTTVARLLALLEGHALSLGQSPPSVALAAPTGKAAARMAEAVHAEARRLDVPEEVRDRLLGLGASTVHRLLGRNPGSASKFRHNAKNRLPHDVVVVDETSMMSLGLMARLLEAVRPEARVVLLGDHEQLASVEAGAVLADVVGPAADRAVSGRLGECISVLSANHRFSGPLADLAASVRLGDPDEVIALLELGRQPRCLRSPGQGPRTPGGQLAGSPVHWLDIDASEAGEPELSPIREAVVDAGRAIVTAAQQGDAAGAIAALGSARVLCAHRDGPFGASTWNTLAEHWLRHAGVLSSPVAGEAPSVPGAPPESWYLGRPVVVTQNDYSLGLFNGDTGVAVRRNDAAARPELGVAFSRAGSFSLFSPSLLASAETAFAMTAHRAQGSEFDRVIVVLPTSSSRILTRELLYTALTRARAGVLLVGTEAAVRRAVSTRVSRASGLTNRLWGAGAGC